MLYRRIWHFSISVHFSLRFPSFLKSLNVLAIEPGCIVDVDRDDQPILYPLMNRLPLHVKKHTHLFHCEQLPWSLLFVEANHRLVDERSQLRPVKLLRKLERLAVQRVTKEVATNVLRRLSDIPRGAPP